jgi:hypothetical protein
MSGDEIREPEELSGEELDEQRVEKLPDREVMSLMDANVAIPLDAAIAANVLSDESIAAGDAEQDAEVDQST